MSKERNSHLPTSRLGRFSRFSRLAGRVAGGMAAEGVRQLAQGKRPKLEHMILTPANARRLTSELSKMRGAAMKLGQMLSMDGGDFVPQELSDILSRLRSDAHTLPEKQLNRQLALNYGDDWRDRFRDFDRTPIAAASIGQVHRATTHAGETIALKIQYPGVRDSINSDVENLIGLLKASGLLPKGLDISAIVEDVKRQLMDEADYLQEAQHLSAFYGLLKGDPRFSVPRCVEEHTTKSILAMEFAPSEPIEVVADLNPARRNGVMKALLELMLKELFELRLMQTDPNFANYRFDSTTGKVVLLDFGATRRFSQQVSAKYRRLMKAMARADADASLAAARDIGYLTHKTSARHQQVLSALFALVGEVISSREPYDFRASDFNERLMALGEEMARFKSEWHPPPADALYIHRKLGGMFLLARRLDTQVAIAPLIAEL